MPAIADIGASILAEMIHLYEPLKQREVETHLGSQRHWPIEQPAWAATLVHAPSQRTLEPGDENLDLEAMTTKYLKPMAKEIADQLITEGAKSYHTPNPPATTGEQTLITMHGIPLMCKREGSLIAATVVYSK